MTVTIHGVIADKTGHCLWHEYGPEILNGYISPRCETRFAAYPADDYDDVQPAHLPVQIDHDGSRRGEVIYLERAHDQLYGVAVIDRPYEPEDFDGTRHYWSSTTAQRPGQPLRMTELSLTEPGLRCASTSPRHPRRHPLSRLVVRPAAPHPTRRRRRPTTPPRTTTHRRTTRPTRRRTHRPTNRPGQRP